MDDGDPGNPGNPPSPESPAEDAASEALWRRLLESSSAEEFHRSWLELQCRLAGGVVGAVLVLAGGDGSQAPGGAASYAPRALWPAAYRLPPALAQLAERCLTTRQVQALEWRPMAGAAAASAQADLAAARLAPRLLVALPLVSGSHVRGTVAAEMDSAARERLALFIEQLRWGSAWLDLRERALADLRDGARHRRAQQVLKLLATMLRHRRNRRRHAAAAALCTELASALACERVSLGFARAGRVRLEAISNTANFDRKTNLSRAIEGAMEECRDQGRAVVYPARIEAGFVLTEAHRALAASQGAAAITTLPLADGDDVAAVLCLERRAGPPFDAAAIELAEALASLAGPVCALLSRASEGILARGARAGRESLRKLAAPGHVAFKLAALGLAGLLVFLVLARGDFRVHAEAVLEGRVQQVVVAPIDGYIVEAPARAGDIVAESAVLCSLDDRDLRLERLRLVGQKDQVLKQQQAALAQRQAAHLRIFDSQLEQVAAQLDLIDAQLARMRVQTPLAGMVVEGDLSQSIGSPVRRGQALFRIAPLDRYRVILQVHERDLAHVEIGQRGELILNAFPLEVYELEVTSITPVSSAFEGENRFRVEAELRGQTQRLRPGLEGLAKISAGRRARVWIWTHEAVDWLRVKLWRWLP
jgi:multidrug resistance efflux pump